MADTLLLHLPGQARLYAIITLCPGSFPPPSPDPDPHRTAGMGWPLRGGGRSLRRGRDAGRGCKPHVGSSVAFAPGAAPCRACSMLLERSSTHSHAKDCGAWCCTAGLLACKRAAHACMQLLLKRCCEDDVGGRVVGRILFWLHDCKSAGGAHQTVVLIKFQCVVRI